MAFTTILSSFPSQVCVISCRYSRLPSAILGRVGWRRTCIAGRRVVGLEATENAGPELLDIGQNGYFLSLLDSRPSFGPSITHMYIIPAAIIEHSINSDLTAPNMQ